MTVELGRFGVWALATRYDGRAEAAAGLEELGFGTLWLGGAPDGGVLGLVAELLDATDRLIVATGILNVWTTPSAQVNAGYRELAQTDRFLVGVGAGHRESVGEAYHSPYQKLVHYLDELDVPRDRLALAALGPRVLRLAAARTSVVHPYLVTPEYTARARETIGSGPLLAPEQHVVLEEDPAAARAVGRENLAYYLGLENYARNWLRSGFTEDDLRDGGSDRLVDALVAWGSVDRVARRLREHHEAGADHVSVQLLGEQQDTSPRFRELAAALAE
ncbi:LLM class F420-dependent oxidoreductase [Saccharothrix algeriensis]|uniref:F420-dependent oxidoreductase n=1 Tax=Saccharothrix algeriensis TaxID=173560 RepID=A0A8T8HSF8_9PSEU|nr:LLM class F420-dependent oxidoreductase [Saccharothrix algeriensis]MBM7812368.1 putative F420-dependent oxidoreductase [Saccharothrix algeriensis]QTR01130.1 LLM class F420-dependent oxidoreductase [Saccharothrix algeriensis]